MDKNDDGFRDMFAAMRAAESDGVATAHDTPFGLLFVRSTGTSVLMETDKGPSPKPYPLKRKYR